MRFRLVARLACFGLGIGLAAACADAAPSTPGTLPPRTCCTPNAWYYGFFETSWRQWPGPLGPGQVFPRSVGSEVLQTPPGEVEVPLPKAPPGKEPGAKDKGEILPEPVPVPQRGPGHPESGPPGGKTAPALPETKGGTSPPPSKGTERAAPAMPSGKPPATGGPVLPEKPSPLQKMPGDEDVPAEPSKEPGPAKPKPGEPNATAASAASAVGTKAVPAGNLQADWETAFYPESMTGGQLRAVGAAALSPERADVQLAGYTEETAQSSPPLLDGYCPVQLCDHERWVRGDARYQVTYQGRTLWLSGAAERQQFLASPRRYVPAWGGNDPVLWAQEGRQIGGTPTHSAIYNQRLYLFAGAATLQRFRQDPERYTPPGE